MPEKENFEFIEFLKEMIFDEKSYTIDSYAKKYNMSNIEFVATVHPFVKQLMNNSIKFFFVLEGFIHKNRPKTLSELEWEAQQKWIVEQKERYKDKVYGKPSIAYTKVDGKFVLLGHSHKGGDDLLNQLDQAIEKGLFDTKKHYVYFR